ncbi:MAG: hypothetical protein JNK15_02760 [Planctomycetes bacterium]|nr:hypothetical protein [Planctomycetota bacterium]
MRGILSILVLVAGAALRAQERVELVGPEPGTIALGESARAELRIVDPGGTPRRPRLPDVPGLALQLSNPTQATEIVNGHMTQSLVFSLDLVPQQAGSFVVPSFPGWTGTQEQ